MSARNPLTIIKDTVYSALNRAYYVKKMRETTPIIDYIHGEIVTVISPSLIIQMQKAWIRDLITSRLEQTEFFSEQPDLFHDLEYQLAFRKGRTTYQCALGDMTLAEVLTLQHRQQANINAAQKSAQRFNRAVQIIRPLLEANPGWQWRDAVGYLENNGGIPDLS